MAGGVEGFGTGARPRAGWYPLVGLITSAGFASGDRFVCGLWEESPLGPIADLMWARPDGRRLLVAPTPAIAAFVSAVYRLDDVVVGGLHVDLAADRVLHVEVPELDLRWRARAGRGWPIPLSGPRWVTRYVAGPVARRVLGVQTYGVSPTGVREWYRARWYRPLVDAQASLSEMDLGALAPLDPPVGFGFSEPPRRPSMVWVRPLLHDPSGQVSHALAAWRPAGGGPTPPPP